MLQGLFNSILDFISKTKNIDYYSISKQEVQ